MTSIDNRKKREQEVNKSYPPVRVSKSFDNELKDIMKQRIVLGKDDPLKPTPSWRLTLANVRHPLFQKIKRDIIIANLKDPEEDNE